MIMVSEQVHVQCNRLHARESPVGKHHPPHAVRVGATLPGRAHAVFYECTQVHLIVMYR